MDCPQTVLALPYHVTSDVRLNLLIEVTRGTANLGPNFGIHRHFVQTAHRLPAAAPIAQRK